MTIPQLFEKSVTQFPSNTLVFEKDQSSRYQAINYLEIRNRVYSFANGLIKMGAKHGDRIALLSEGRSEWLVAELGMLYLGVVNVPLSIKINESEDLCFRIEHSGCRFVVVSQRQLHKIRVISSKLSAVEKIVVISDDEPVELVEGEVSYECIFNIGTEEYAENKERFNGVWTSVKEDDLANISYTSGTTADPKGIMLSHRNYTANVEQAKSLVDIYAYYSSLLILPWDHSFGHTVGLYTLIDNGASLSVVELGKTPMETLRNIPKNIKEVQPTFLLSVPALAKNFKKNIEKGIKEKGAKIEKLFAHALKVAYCYNANGWDRGKGFKVFLKPLVYLYDKIVFSKIREGFGGKLEFFIGGGALLDIELQNFFYAIGMPMYQGYGLSEASPIISSNSPKKHKLGSSGFLVANLDLKICDTGGDELSQGMKGEIVVKGENVMKGYWRNEDATENALKDGWLYTGDMGYLDKDGFLYVLGRFKSLLIGSDGEKYSPEGIEEVLAEHSLFIEQLMLYNNQNTYTSALVYPNISLLGARVKEEGFNITEDEGAKRALQLLQEEIGEYLENGKYGNLFPHRWLPSAIGILEEGFTEENKLLNSTMKMVRVKVEDKYRGLINYMYTAEGKVIDNVRNVRCIKSL